MYTEGQRVEIIDIFEYDTAQHYAWATVKTAGKAYITVETESGDLQKYRTKDNRIVGYDWPNLTLAIKRDTAGE